MTTAKDVIALLLLASAISCIAIYYVVHQQKPDLYKTFCDIKNCPTTITADNSGLEYDYGPSVKFDVILDSKKYDINALTCKPANIINTVANSPAVQPPDIAIRFEGVGIGQCILSSGDFSVRIKITDPY